MLSTINYSLKKMMNWHCLMSSNCSNKVLKHPTSNYAKYHHVWLFKCRDSVKTTKCINALYHHKFWTSQTLLKDVSYHWKFQNVRTFKSLFIEPPACAICGALANVKCMDCPKDYCATCFQIQHQHQNHNHKAVDMRNDYPTLLHHQTVPRIHMDLFAVVCIETSHYVSFVKAGELPDAPWLFFDSMSDRRGNYLN